MDANVQPVPPTTPGTKVRQLKADLQTKETENDALRSDIDGLVKALGKIDLVKSDSTPVGDDDKDKKSKKCPVVPAKTAYKFFCDSLPSKTKEQEKSNLQQLWKEADPKIREEHVVLGAADKARYQSEMNAYNEEQKALEMYYGKKKQEQAMAFYEAHLEAQAALEKSQGEDKKKKTVKDPDAPKRCTSSYMFYAQAMRLTVVKAHPEAKVTEIAKILGEMWSKLDKTKSGKNGAKKYEDMAARDRERYNKEKTVYDAKVAERKEGEEREKEARLEQEKKEAMELLESQTVQIQQINIGNGAEIMSVMTDGSGKKGKKKDPNAPKKALTAYNYFVSENRESIKTKMPESATNAEVFTEVGKSWKALSEAKKNKYSKLSAKDQKRYAKDMEKYNATKTSN